jgi:hypothetical protein
MCSCSTARPRISLAAHLGAHSLTPTPGTTRHTGSAKLYPAGGTKLSSLSALTVHAAAWRISMLQTIAEEFRGMPHAWEDHTGSNISLQVRAWPEVTTAYNHAWMAAPLELGTRDHDGEGAGCHHLFGVVFRIFSSMPLRWCGLRCQGPRCCQCCLEI